MGLFSVFRQSDYFTAGEKERIVSAIKNAEKNTSGEVRVFIESRCRFVNPLDRASEIFWGLKMDHTDRHNAVLIYIAIRDHQYAVFADEGIHQKLGEDFWNKEVKAMYVHFKENQVAEAIARVIDDVGKALNTHFPYEPGVDKNELPDDIVFGK